MMHQAPAYAARCRSGRQRSTRGGNELELRPLLLSWELATTSADERDGEGRKRRGGEPSSCQHSAVIAHLIGDDRAGDATVLRPPSGCTRLENRAWTMPRETQRHGKLLADVHVFLPSLNSGVLPFFLDFFKNLQGTRMPTRFPHNRG